MIGSQSKLRRIGSLSERGGVKTDTPSLKGEPMQDFVI